MDLLISRYFGTSHVARAKFRHLTAVLVTLSLFASLDCAQAEVRLPHVLGSHMVLQQQKPLIVWGWANAGETVEVSLAGKAAKTQASPQGEWKVTLPAMTAGGPYTLSVKGGNTITCENVMIGEVWLCSGQSNMEMGIGACQNGKEEIAAADHPMIRLFMVPNKWTAEPLTNTEPAEWKVCSPETIAQGGWSGFSAAGYYFGRELRNKLGVAIGLIDATWGGTRIESWTPPEGFAGVPALKSEYERVQLGSPGTDAHQERLGSFLAETERWLDQAREAKARRTLVPPMPQYPAELLPPNNLQHATALYNGMIHPLHPFPLAGAIWYQGEANLGDGALYTERMKALIGGWRKVWNQGEVPFYFVQIAPFDYGGEPERMGVFWEAQAAAARQVPNSGMVVINDIGNLKDIHPTNKQEVGRRLALWALAKTYGSNSLVCAGPTFREMKIEGNRARLFFDNTAGGLVSRDGKPLTWFYVIDADEGGFVPADVRIEGDTLIVSSPEVKRPAAVRYAWSMLAEPNLANKAGLPAGAFQAGQIPKRDLLAMKVPEARQYKLVYDLDLAKLGREIKWDEDHSSQIDQSFDRVAYFLELQTSDGNTQFVYASMDAFTDSLAKLGIPTHASGARFQQNVTGLNVYSNVKGITTGMNLAGGNIEFWPNNYGPGNGAQVPNASDKVYDFGDDPSDPADGYGSLQIHNSQAKQTLLAINHWGEGARADLGIGNQPKGNADWTFAANAGSYKAKRLRVLVRCK